MQTNKLLPLRSVLSLIRSGLYGRISTPLLRTFVPAIGAPAGHSDRRVSSGR